MAGENIPKHLPSGQQWINMGGDIKSVNRNLAFDKSLQKSSKFFPCDENGVAINQPADEPQQEKKSISAPVAEVDVTIDLPKGLDIVLPDDNKAVQDNEDKLNALAESETEQTEAVEDAEIVQDIAPETEQESTGPQEVKKRKYTKKEK